MTAPWRCSSAKPRIEVSGVRSSWLASATNRRIRSSERRAVASDAARAPNAPSIWASMALSARPGRPISVRGSVVGDPAGQVAAGDGRRGVLDLGQRAQRGADHE